MSLTQYPLLTFADVVDHVIDEVVGGDFSARNLRQAKRAVMAAYDELPARRDWRYYYRPVRVNTVDSQTDGTIAFDLTGGSSERLITLTGSTLPADAAKYRLSIGVTVYEIERYLSSTTLQLSERACPAEDVDAGTSYRLFRDTYELPSDFRKMAYLHDTRAPGTLLAQVDPGAIMAQSRLVKTVSLPVMYSVYKTTQFASGMAVTFAPAPASARTYDAIGLFWPSPLKVLDYAIGTVAVASDSTSLTGTSTAFTSDHEGAVIRISSDASLPTSQIGQVDKNLVNPYAMQRVIQRRPSATALTLEQAADQTFTASGYRISSRIDIEPGAMRQAFLRLAEAMFGTQDRKGLQDRRAAFENALALASWADQRMQESPSGGYIPKNLADVAASVQPTGN